MSTFFFYIGIIILLIGWIIVLVQAFKKSILWGFGSFFFTPVYIIFLIKNWTSSKFAFFLQFTGMAIILVFILLNENERVFEPLLTLALIIGHHI